MSPFFLEETSGFTMMFIFVLLYPVYKISARRNVSISTYSTLPFSKLDQNGTFSSHFSILAIVIYFHGQNY